MRIISHIKSLCIISALILLVTGCKDDSSLLEVPKDFLTPENAYTTPSGIEQGLFGLYEDIRNRWYRYTGTQSYGLFGMGTDIGYDGETPGGQRFLTNYLTSVIPSYSVIRTWWTYIYKEIQMANLIIERIDKIDQELWVSEAQKNMFIAEARFFRAWNHRIAVTLWGDVPLVSEVINDAKTDFIRNPTTEVYEFIEEDLLFASQNLPDPGNETAPGRLTKGAALQLLTEVYLATQQWNKAIESSSRVINDFGYSLMTERFGNQVNTFGGGDVFWDLFRYDNQNAPVNSESIWVIQFEPGVSVGGSGLYWSGIYGPRLEKFGNAPDGLPAFKNHYSDTLGVQVARMRGTNHVFYGIWKDNWDNDIRNSKYNIKRNFYYENPDSEYDGKVIDLAEFPDGARNLLKDTTNYIYPFFMKGWQPVVQATIADAARGGAGTIHSDFMVMRLAETYLLRAEAFLGMGDKNSAANDINVVRNRAKATPVMPEDVDIDYILDERIRELYGEEMRMITLLRTGKLIDRVREYHDNPLLPGANIQDYNNVWPIPQAQIDLNTGAEFPQNPGYE